MTSCETDQHSSSWSKENSLTISQYLNKNQHEYSKSYRLWVEGKLLNTLYAYNPNGDFYTLFLPTDEAIDHFIEQNQKYGNFEELLKDTSFIKRFTRYHTLNKKLHTYEFPDGVFIDSTLTGDRLVVSFFANGDNQFIKINNLAPIIKPNLEMTNGYIHVISEVIQPVDISGYDWLQQQNQYSILAQAMELSGIKKKLSWDKYTLFAEPDSIYHRYGIKNVEDLISRIATPGIPLTTKANEFYQFTSYHILDGEYYMNEFNWGSKKYLTFSEQLMTISVGQHIMINTGVDTYGTTLSESGDTTVIDYIRPLTESSNILTRTGPVHSISDLMYYKKLP
ncbi:MAG TPA: fasciclin domain-containing protein [Prolixibacteraceae bacterium]|nr:fasciclin domain-containing protein [Prolixibacteraceae bacterium]